MICWCKRAVLSLCSVTVCGVEESTQTTMPPFVLACLVPQLELDPWHSAAPQEEMSPSNMHARMKKWFAASNGQNSVCWIDPFWSGHCGVYCFFAWTHCSHTINGNGMFLHQESSPHLKKWKNCKWPWKLSLHHQCIFQNSNSLSKLGKKFICWKSLETGLRMGTQDSEFEIWSLRVFLLGVIPIPICHTVNGWKLDLQQEIWARICFTLQSTCKIHWDNFEIGKTQSFKELSSVDVVQRLW